MPVEEQLQRILGEYDRNLAGLEAQVIGRVNTALEASYKQLEKKLLEAYPRLQANGSLVAIQQKTLLQSEITDLLALINSRNSERIYQDFEYLLQTSNGMGGTLASELHQAIANQPLKATTGVPVDALRFAAENAVKRLSKHDQEFQEKATAIVGQGLIQNWGVQRSTRLLRQELGITKGKAERIIRTETLAATNEAAQASFKEAGIKHFQFIATQDDRLCPFCAARNLKVFKLGQSVPPIHPFCRCFSMPWMERWVDEGLLDVEWQKQYREDSLKELESTGKQLNNGLSPFEKAAGLTKPPKPVWSPDSKPKTAKTKTEPSQPPSPTISAPAFPDDLESLETVKMLGGSTGATLVRDPVTGKLFVLKRGNSPAHLQEEMLADAAYQALGVPVPEFKAYTDKNGKPVKLAEYIEGRSLKEVLSKGTKAEKESVLQKLQKGFAADALLGNWDVVGMELDNVLVDKSGNVWRIDNGGSLRYRAQGQAKGAAWNGYATELFTLRNDDVNEQTASVFSSVKWSDVVNQIDDLAKKEKALLKALPKELHPTIQNRLAEMRHVSAVSRTLLDDQWRDDYTSDFAKHTMGLRQAGIVDRFPQQLTQKSKDNVLVVDENGDLFDSLRGSQSIIADLDKYVTRAGGQHQIITRWMSEQGGDSWNEEPQAFKYFYANQRNSQLDNYWWKFGTDNAKNAYRDTMQLYGEKTYRETLIAWHSFNHELLTKTTFARKNLDGSITLIRTENEYVMQTLNKLKPGDRNVKIKRGFAESTSIYDRVEVFGTELTVQNVPKHRVFGTYWTEKRPGADNSGFLGDSENEFVVLMDDIPFDYVGEGEDEDDAIARKQKQAGGAVAMSKVVPNKKSNSQKKSKPNKTPTFENTDDFGDFDDLLDLFN